MIARSRSGLVALLLAGLVAATASAHSACAATHEQILAMCREKFQAELKACVLAKGLPGSSFEIRRQHCGIPIVQPCVWREEQRQAAGTPAPAVPKDDNAVATKDAGLIQPTFVAPPRTIADITAILDSEPNEAKIAKRKARADAGPPAGHDGVAGRTGLCRQLGPNRLQLRASVILGAVFVDWRRRGDLNKPQYG